MVRHTSNSKFEPYNFLWMKIDVPSYGIITWLVPVPLICVTSLVVAIGLHENAFEVEYRSFQELVETPNMDQATAVPLKWKKEFYDRDLFNCTDSILCEKWKPLTFLSGYGDDLRRYCVRLGAAKAFDGSLSEATRNTIMDHSSRVFQRFHQPTNLDVDTQRLRFQNAIRADFWHRG